MEISPEVWFRHGEASFRTQRNAQAVESLVTYLTKADREAENFGRGVNLLVEAHEEVRGVETDSQSLIAQFSPGIQIELFQVYVHLHKERDQHADAAIRLDQLLALMEESNWRFTSGFWRDQAVWREETGCTRTQSSMRTDTLENGIEACLSGYVSCAVSRPMSEAVTRTAEQFDSMDVDAGREFKDCDECPVMVVIPPQFFDGLCLGIEL